MLVVVENFVIKITTENIRDRDELIQHKAFTGPDGHFSEKTKICWSTHTIELTINQLSTTNTGN